MEINKNMLLGRYGHVYIKHHKLINQWVIDWNLENRNELHISELKNFEKIDKAIQLENYKSLYVNCTNEYHKKEFKVYVDEYNKLKVELMNNSIKNLGSKIVYH